MTTPYQPYLVPVSIKCIVFEDGKVWLRKNERNEWELPGGKIDEGEQPEETAAREALEELGLQVRVGNIIGAVMYKISVSADEHRGVFVAGYYCSPEKRVADVEHIGEAGRAEFKLFEPTAVADLNMPEFYKKWIKNVET